MRLARWTRLPVDFLTKEPPKRDSGQKIFNPRGGSAGVGEPYFLGDEGEGEIG
jgi:hypothetical protein